ENKTICSNQLPYRWNGKTINTGGKAVAQYIYTNVAGCDSIVTLNLTVKDTVNTVDNITICSNEFPYYWNGIRVNTGGDHIATPFFTNAAGCDSIVTLNLNIKNIASTEIRENNYVLQTTEA